MASIIKRCACGGWGDCPHPWVVRYRTDGGRTSKQREQSFGSDLKEAADFPKGIPITEVSRWLGHNSIEVTHQIYGHLVPASWDRARTVLDDARRAGRHPAAPPETPR